MPLHGERGREAQFQRPFPLSRDAREPRGQGIRVADAGPGGNDPQGAGGQGPRGPVAHRHGQDRRVRDPDRREGGHGARRRSGGGVGAHPRAGDPGGARNRGARSGTGRQGAVGLRRRLDGAPGRGHPRRRARDRRHARPRARPPAARHARLLGRALPRARRGRPHARHGFRGRDGPDHGVRPSRAPDHALLRDRTDRDQGPDLPLHGRARVGAAVRGPDLRQGGRARLLHGLAPAQGGDALPPARVREPDLLNDLLQYARGDAPGLDLPQEPRAGGGDAVVRPAAEEARAGDGRVSRRARFATW